MKIEAKANDELLELIGFTKQSVYTDEIEGPLEINRDMLNKFYINYFDHGHTGGWTDGLNVIGLNENNIWMDSPFIVSEACSTCSFKSSYNYGVISYAAKNVFCTNVIRRGAIGHIGAVETASSGDVPSKIFLESLLRGRDFGTSLKQFIKYNLMFKGISYDSYHLFVLIGDPTFIFLYGNTSSEKGNN